MAHVGSTGLIFPIRQMKGNTIFLESAKANIGDSEALIPIMLDPGNQISFKSGHCRVGDQVVVLPAWGRKDNFIAIKGWGSYELSKESFLVFYHLDWTYEGYPGRCTTYEDGYIWKERFWWATIPVIPSGYPEYFDLQVMRKGLEGHPNPSNSNYPQNCSDGTAVYQDDINVQYSNENPFIPDQALWIPYGQDYMTYYYTAFPKRDNICAIIIPEFGSSYWIDDVFCPAYVEPPVAVDGIAAIQDGTNVILSWPSSQNENDLILIRFKKSSTPPTVVPNPLDTQYGVIEQHGDYVYFGPRNIGDNNITHYNLDYFSTYTYTIWNVETRLDEDGDPLYVYNQYESGYGQNYPRTDPVYASVTLETPQSINLIGNSTFDNNSSAWWGTYYGTPPNIENNEATLKYPTYATATLKTPNNYHVGGDTDYISINSSEIQTLYMTTNITLNTLRPDGVATFFIKFRHSGGWYEFYISLYSRKDLYAPAWDTGEHSSSGVYRYFFKNNEINNFINMLNYLTSSKSLYELYSMIPNTISFTNITHVSLQWTVSSSVTTGRYIFEIDDIYLWQNVVAKCDISGNPIIE